jgi:class 3 adenylate cyclase
VIATGYGVVVGLQNDAYGAVARWSALMTTVLATGIVVGGIAARAEELSESEHRARDELAALNDTLEQRVTEQVDELDRLGRMRRFVSPQIADVLLTSGTEEPLQPHRRKIATVFCDLRGFTAFTNGTEPEEVVDVLAEYYRTAGEILRAHQATIGGYAGDGIMAYFGDPVPCDEPALDAVRMAADLVPAMNRLVESWEERGYRLHYGIGIADGYATLGVVGFDGRYDYTPLGAVVNLAARLCSCAGPGQVLLDHHAHVATAAAVRSREVTDIQLKGFGTETRVYALEPITLRAVRPRDSAAG